MRVFHEPGNRTLDRFHVATLWSVRVDERRQHAEDHSTCRADHRPQSHLDRVEPEARDHRGTA